VFWYLLTGDAPIVRGKFYEMRTYYINTLPIPQATAEQKAALATLATTAQTHAEARYALQDGLCHRIYDLRPTGSTTALNTKLKEWWLLPDFAAFRAEVKKCFKADIELSERTAWEKWITRDRAEIARLTAEIAKSEDKINAQVYALFDLTPDEITLLESAV
jgi:neutral trehalase